MNNLESLRNLNTYQPISNEQLQEVTESIKTVLEMAHTDQADFIRLRIITNWSEKEILQTASDAELSFRELGDLVLGGKFPIKQ